MPTKTLTTILLSLIAFSSFAQTSDISTVVGTGIQGYGGDGGSALSAKLNNPVGIYVDKSANIFIADVYNQCIRKVDGATNIITTIAGNGVQGYMGDGGDATAAELSNPGAVCTDASGNVYISDGGNNVIRKVDATTHKISTIAGTGLSGYTGDGGLATAADLARPAALAIDASGNIFFVDMDNSVVRKITASTGKISTVAGNNTVGCSGDGGSAKSAELSGPTAIAVNAAGDLFIMDLGCNTLRKVKASTGIITTIAGNSFLVGAYSGDGGPAVNARLNEPYGMCMDGLGNFYIGDNANGRIRRVSAATGKIYTIAGTGISGYSGDGGPALNASFDGVAGMGTDASGAIYFSDQFNNRIRKLTVPVSVEEVSKNITFNLYPSPLSNDELHIETSTNDKIANIQITDVTGKLMQSISHPFATASDDMIKVSAEKGTYFIRILFTDNTSVVKPFVKL